MSVVVERRYQLFQTIDVVMRVGNKAIHQERFNKEQG